MDTRIAWLLNLDAELELEDPLGYRPSESMEQRIRALAPRMTMLLRASDLLLTWNGEREPDDHCVPLAFCPTPSALLRMRAMGLVPLSAPSLEVLQRVNSRAFCAELGQTLPGAAYVHDMESLERVIQGPSPTGDFVLKRPFAFAGRERRRAIGGKLDASTLGFAKRSFERGEGLQVEPWVERRGDYAQHGYVHPSGRFLMGPVVEQLCDAMGRWERSQEAARDVLSEPEAAALLASVRAAGEALQQAGYFGPYGIDAFRYLDGTGKLAFQARSEINARFTMGYPRVLLEAALREHAH